MSEAFNKAVEEVKNFTIRPRDDILLDLYALFKQVTVGDVNTSRPFMLDFKGTETHKSSCPFLLSHEIFKKSSTL